MYRLSIFLILLSLSGCRVHDVMQFDQPPVPIPEGYFYGKEGEVEITEEWWKQFGIPQLNEVVETVLRENFDLKQAWDRLSQAQSLARIAGSELFPKVDLTADIIHTRGSGPHSDHLAQTRFLLGGSLYYEVDLWRRITSRTAAAEQEACASWQDVGTTALLLSGVATDLWFAIQEQRELLELFEHQLTLNKTLLELVELRFSTGQASALDVYQQRLQLAQTESQVPSVELALKTLMNELSILMGTPPGALPEADTKQMLVNLPPFPKIGGPVDLLWRRPDLRASQHRLMAADYEVAAAIADRFPKLSFLLSYDSSADTWGEIFNREMWTIVGRLLTPLIDGGRRRAEVDRRKAILCQRLHGFGGEFLFAVSEVEDAILRENYQLQLILQLLNQKEIAEANLREAQSRYVNGLNDYLPVIAAIQSLQTVERRIVSEHRRLLSSRVLLYRALGGYCFVQG